MTLATIKLGREKFGRSTTGLVYGEISLVIDGTSFPDPRWTDFVVVILEWWCHAVLQILQGKQYPIEMRFMEGPYLVELELASDGLLNIALVESGLKRQVHRYADVELSPFVQSLLAATDQTLTECRNRGWWSDDTDKLSNAAQSLQSKVSPRLN